MGLNKVVLVILVVFTSIHLDAQDRYMVFFSDKEQVPYSIDQPQDFLSERAIARREKMDIPITTQDLPVDQAYVDQVKARGAEVYFKTKWFNGVLTQMSGGLVTSIANLPFVDSVVYVAKGVNLTPGGREDYSVPDTFIDLEGQTSSTITQLAMLQVDEMHEDGYQGQDMLIAVFDSGFPGINLYKPFEHIFKEKRLIATKDFVGNSGNVFQYHSHGASVFSCISASQGTTISGTAPKASYVLCVTEDTENEYRVEEYNWLFAAEFADSIGVDVINGSLGYSTFSEASMNYTYEDLDGATAIVSKAAKIASDKGMVVVVSGGNEGSSPWKYVTAPADAEEVLTVGSVGSNYKRASHSSYGPTADGRIKPDVVAMGSSTSIFNGDSYTSGGGTSFASPQIAGFVAGVWQAHPEWSNDQVIEAVKMSGTNILSPDTAIGYGVPKYTIAVSGRTIAAVDVFEDKLTIYPNPFSDGRVYLDFGGVEIKGNVEILVSDVNGKSVFAQKFNGRELPNQLEIEINPVVNGVYFLMLQTRKFKKTVKLVKI